MDNPNTVPWLRSLAEKGGKGVVDNIDARSLGRIADEIEQLRKAHCACVFQDSKCIEPCKFHGDQVKQSRKLLNEAFAHVECLHDADPMPDTAQWLHEAKEALQTKDSSKLVIGVDFGKDESVTVYRCTACNEIFDSKPEGHQCVTGKNTVPADLKMQGNCLYKSSQEFVDSPEGQSQIKALLPEKI